MSDDSLNVEVPEPLAFVRQEVIHTDNVELVAHDDRARLLPKRERSALQARRRQLLAILARYDYDSRVARVADLKQQYAQCRFAAFNARESGDLSGLPGLRRQRNRIVTELRAIRDALAPARPAASELLRIDQRLDEHRQAVANERLYRRLRRDMAKETQIYAELIIQTWNRLGYCYDYTHKGKHRRKSVQFERVIATEDELQFKIDVASLSLVNSTIHHLPAGVRVWDLIRPETLLELSVACECEVISPHVGMGENANFNNGAWLVVRRLGLSDGLFNYITLPAVWAYYPNDKRDRFPLLLGVKRGRTINRMYLAEQPHIMINGQNGSGKSNLINVILCTLARYHSPDEVRVVLIDLKEGAELRPYAGLPHALGPLINDIDQVEAMMLQLESERKRRMHQIGAIAHDINEYNSLVRPEQRIPRIVVVFDEFAALNIAPEIERRVHRVVSALAMKARAAGIHLVIGAQAAYAEQIPQAIRTNVTLTVGGRQRTIGASQTVFGSKAATQLARIPGRMLCQDSMDVYPMQVPHCRRGDIEETLAIAAHYEAPRPFELPSLEETTLADPRELGPGDIVDIALREFNGDLKVRPIWRYLDGEISEVRVSQMVKAMVAEGMVSHRGANYIVERGAKNWYQLRSFAAPENGHSGEAEHEAERERET